MPRHIPINKITAALESLMISAAFELPDDIKKILSKSALQEKSKTGKNIFAQINENCALAKKHKTPLCQDTGLALVFLEIGQNVLITGNDLEKAIQKTVAKVYGEKFLRKSVVDDPLNRKNTNDNTPAIIYTQIVPGSKVKITFMAKGGGSENCSSLKMLKPSDNLEGVENFVLETVRVAHANPCPPIIVGIGIGGNFDHVTYLAKKALLRPLGTKNRNIFYKKLEDKLLKRINKLGIGPMGLGGNITALAVHIETHPCHMASLPVAVNIQCHAHRIASAYV